MCRSVRQTAPELPPEAASKILQDLDWEVCVMPAQKQRYFYSKSRREARYQPPYHSILGLEDRMLWAWRLEWWPNGVQVLKTLFPHIQETHQRGLLSQTLVFFILGSST
eukprot:g32146.t1